MSQTAVPPPRPSFADTEKFIRDVRQRVATVVVGQDVVVERLLIALFSGGHLLLQGVPGLAKTLLVSVLSKSVDLDFARIQFTIDLLPSDILGSEVLDQRTNEFRVRKGPVFTNLLLADEINRAAPKVQGALLEAMQERKVTIGNETFRLPAPFLVIATQNPVEQAGTFELPEAQLDRFMLVHRLEYPSSDEEREILVRNAALGIQRQDKGAIVQTEFDVLEKKPVGSSEELVRAMEAVHHVHVSETFVEHVVGLVESSRRHPAVELGCSPRAGISLIKASRARALMHGRHYAIPEDLFALAEDVMLHRMRLKYEAIAEGINGRAVLQELLRSLGRQRDTRVKGEREPRDGMQGYLEEIETLDSRQFVMAVRKLANGLSYGTDHSPFVGSGVEYVQSRPYQQGDSVRAIDWKVTARARRFYVKEYESPKSMPVYLMIDTSASMAVSSQARSKYATALYVAGGLALAALDRVSPVGVVGVGERALRVRPSLSKQRVLEWVLALRRYRYDEGTQLGQRLRELAPTLAQRSLMIVLSDLHDPSAIPALKHLAQLHDCVVLQLSDPAEVSCKGAGFLRAVEAETGREFVTRGGRRWNDPEAQAAEWRRAGIDHLLIRTDQPFAHALRHLFRARGWAGRGTR